jgi:hypothetical protein
LIILDVRPTLFVYKVDTYVPCVPGFSDRLIQLEQNKHQYGNLTIGKQISIYRPYWDQVNTSLFVFFSKRDTLHLLGLESARQKPHVEDIVQL